LEARFGIVPGSGVQSKFLKSDGASPEISGIALNSSKDYYTNTGEVVCDGDLFLRGTLFLNEASVSTKNGCRIYVTGPIFLQKGVTYRTPGGTPDEANLQLVSAQAILAGVGDRSCDATSAGSPLSRRLASGYAVSTFFTREAEGKAISPQTLGQSIYAEGKLIAALEDAGCHDDTIPFSRLLLNAPLVHSRYKGEFKRRVIAEFALFRLSLSTYAFDPVFKRVPVLPVLKDTDYLHVK
jgi:hypothetical protein